MLYLIFYPDHVFLRLFICFVLVLLGLQITLDIVFYFRENPSKSKDENRDYYLDSEGNHIYYERSIIEKNLFFKLHPEYPENELKSPSKLLRSWWLAILNFLSFKSKQEKDSFNN